MILMEKDSNKLKSSRKDLHFSRRFFHFSCGMAVGLIYNFFLTHKQSVYILGIIACTIYIIEQIRINYPEIREKFLYISNYLLRAEEQLKESAGVPFVMGVLLTIITFPKLVALSSIFTLAIADPLSAIIGIRFGKNKVVKHKTIEGSAAFFIANISCVLLVFIPVHSLELRAQILLMAALNALFVTFFEMMPLKIDDNLTIPLFNALSLWIFAAMMGVPTEVIY